MANGWGILSWGQGNWGLQGDVSPVLTGEQLTGETGTLEGYNMEGWGRLTWGSLSWGGEIVNVTFTVTGLLATTALSSVSIGIGPDVPVTGEQLSLTENSVSFVSGDANAPLTSDESVRLVTTLNSVTITATGNISLTGEQLTLTENSVIAKADVDISVTGEELTTSQGDVQTQASTSDVYVFGTTINATLGEADPGPDASVSGEQVPIYLGNVNIEGTANLNVTGQDLAITLNSVFVELNTPVDLTGEQLTTTLESVNASISITGSVTQLPILETFILGNLNTTLHDSMTTYDTSAFVNDLTIYEQIPDSGQAKIQDEWVSYSSKYIYTFDANTFVLDGLVRGIRGTTASTHPVNAPISIHDAISVTADANTNTSGQELTLTQGVVDPNPDANLIGQDLTADIGDVSIRLDVFPYVTGENLTLEEGSVDANPDANPIGQQLTGIVGNPLIKIDVNVPVSQSSPVYVSRIGQVTVEAITPVNVTGQLLTLSEGDVFIRLGVVVNLTGNNLTGTLAQLYPTAWETVNTGQSVNWTPVDTAA